VCVYKRHKQFFVNIGENHTMFELTGTNKCWWSTCTCILR
jgi:hypothetical protein